MRSPVAGHPPRECEFITAESRKECLSSSRLQTTCDFKQQRVAHRMSKYVVYFFEAIEVNGHNGKAIADRRCPIECGGKTFIEGCPVWQVGQRVMMRHMRDALFCTLSFRHIFHQAEKIFRLSVVISYGDLSRRDNANIIISSSVRLKLE
jgi:hypothetical protein